MAHRLLIDPGFATRSHFTVGLKSEERKSETKLATTQGQRRILRISRAGLRCNRIPTRRHKKPGQPARFSYLQN
ncbi:MAG: hypothetical protein DMG73_06835 [Acidobacteria bacterium]|nr:MAG: hypothetical protein DMG75_14560 [Acidobacteriota bacterium]PYX60186.1 MAG: hypothetical protein DMG73_06835 [Acidobacteriota bacterium]PYX63504.1 MAG: hypothetical protein DMG74_16735 [Acidobacteriota bacterium]